MIKQLITGLYFLAPFAVAEPNMMHYFTADNIEFRYYQPDLANENVKIFWLNAEGEPYLSLDNLMQEQQNNGTPLLFAMNGGIYSDDARPGGLYIENYQKIKDINLNSGKDNFHTKPNGVFYMQGDIPHIVISENFTDAPDISMAVQSGPLLIHKGKIFSHFTNASPSEYVRNGACVTADNQLYFIQSLTPSNMYRFALVAQNKFACQEFLYLDGFISHMQAQYGENKGTQIRPFISIIATRPKNPK
ncbi:MAG: phosphodiester glycosidase family protein [Alphaproteobacteria bacterium]